MESQKLIGKVVSSQFCIRIGKDEIELVYDHGHQMLTVFVDSELVVQSKYYPTRNTFNYVNLLDIAAKMRTHHYMKKQQQEEKTGMA